MNEFEKCSGHQIADNNKFITLPANPVQKASVWLTRHLHLSILVVLTLIWQAPLFWNSAPAIFPDTSSYKAAADTLLRGQLTGFYFRTPGYPGFLALTYLLFGHSNDYAVMTFQFALGCFIPVLLYSIAMHLVFNKGLALAAGASWLLDRYSVGIQSVILTTSLSQFLLILSLDSYLKGVQRLNVSWALTTGAVFFLAIIVQPALQYLYICMAIGGVVVICSGRPASELRKQAKWAAAFFLTTQVLIWLWSGVVYRETGYFALSTQLGASITNQTGDIMEQAPESFGAPRDLYLAAKQRRLAQGRDVINIYDEISTSAVQATGLPQWELSRRYLAISKYLIVHNPGWYMHRVYHSWRELWVGYAGYLIENSSFGRYTHNSRFYGAIYRLMDSAIWKNLTVLNLMPVLLFCLTLLYAWTVRRERFQLLAMAMITGTIFYHIAVHAAVQSTEFGRYRLPVQPLYISYLVVVIGYFMIRLSRIRSNTRQDPNGVSPARVELMKR